MKRLLIAVVCVSVPALGQTTINGGRIITGAWDASGAATTKAVKSGTSLPAACAVGEYYNKTDDVAGLTLHACTATNTWTRAAYSQGTSAPATCAVGQVYFDTDATAGQNLLGCTSTNTWTALAGGGADGVGYDEVMEEATGLTKRAKLNFTGAGVTCADDSGNSRTNCTIAGGSAYNVFDWAVLEEREDFVGCTTNLSGASGKLPWQYTNFASGNGATACESGTAAHPWTVYISSGTTSNGGRALYGEQNGVVNVSTNYAWQVEWIARTETSSGKLIRIGLADANSASPNNRITWRFEAGTDTYFTLEACASGTCSTQASAVAPSDVWHRFRIWGTASGTIKGCLDACSSDFTISTNVPTADLMPAVLFTTTNASNGWLHVDAFAIKKTGLTRW